MICATCRREFPPAALTIDEVDGLARCPFCCAGAVEYAVAHKVPYVPTIARAVSTPIAESAPPAPRRLRHASRQRHVETVPTGEGIL